MRRVLGLLAALAAAGPASAALNLLSNPGFEAGGNGWKLTTQAGTTAAGSVSYSEAAAAHSGAAGASVEVTATEAANNWKLQLNVPSAWDATAGKVYHLSFWAKAGASATLTLGINRAGKFATSSGFSVTSAWKQYEFFYRPDTSGTGVVAFNVYLAATKGVFDFDDFVLDTVPSSLPTTMVQPAQGAWTTGIHRNLFQELGYESSVIDAKVKSAFDQLFVTGDSANERLYYLAPDDTSMAYIDASGYALTEGMSYGMMITLQMDRQDLFRKLWKFAKAHMQQTSGDRQGYFSWKVSTHPPYTPSDLNPAPDGEEYFVTSLLLAAKRWGNGTGIYNYQEQADSLLGYMTKTKNATMNPLIDPDRKQIVFSPVVGGTLFSDPSYHLPAFYRVWNAFATDKKSGFYAAMADTSWALLKRASNVKSGLFPDYCSFDGAPQATSFNANSATFNTDAHRVGSNIGFSYAWFQDDTAAMRLVKKELGFFASKGAYKAQYSIDGDTAKVTYNSESLLSANAGAVLASDRASDWSFVDALWKTPTPSGTYRYYNGLVTMLNLLHVSGKFKAWGSPGLTAHPELGLHAGAGLAALRLSQVGSLLKVEGVSGNIRLLDARGAVAVSNDAVQGSATLAAPGKGVWIVDAGAAGSRKVVVP